MALLEMTALMSPAISPFSTASIMACKLALVSDNGTPRKPSLPPNSKIKTLGLLYILKTFFIRQMNLKIISIKNKGKWRKNIKIVKFRVTNGLLNSDKLIDL